ncbi:hypothetical protein [Mycolicibacterium phlei]|uniref:hypothetical protein n=1 Tax=Mycolicibacterium phlei TaxID=1771 RepID=UPI0037C8F9F1
MDVDRCRATVFLQESMRRSLAAKIGAEVVSMQRCMLAEGHRDAHSGVPNADGRPLLRWQGRGIRLSEATYNGTPDNNGSRHAVAEAEATPHHHHHHEAPAPEPAVTADHRRDDPLWAIAAALERLADAISAALARR